MRLSIGIIIAFAIGLRAAFHTILSNHYIDHKMYRLSLFCLQESFLTKWALLGIALPFIIYFIWSIFSFIARKLHIPFAPKSLEKHIKDKPLRFFFGIIRITAIALVVILLVFNISFFIYNKIDTPEGPNVILIVVDTLRSDHLSCYGYERNTSPNIDKLASKSMIFDNAISSSSWTLPSVGSILTSLYQSSHGVIEPYHKLRNNITTISEVLKNENYMTAAFISGPFLNSVFNLNQGFDLYDESVSSITLMESHRDITSSVLTKKLLAWLDKNYKKRFFLFIHYWDPHYDYIPPSPFDKMFDPDYSGTIDGKDIETSNKINPDMDKRDLQHIIALYDGEIKWTDMHIGMFFEKMKELNLEDNTIIILTGDHGDEFLEHGGKGHRRTLYQEVIWVPLILKTPALNDSKHIKEVIRTIDIMPTVLDALAIPSSINMEGISLIPFATTEGEGLIKEAYSELLSDSKSLITDKWKIIYNLSSHKFELYDLKNDPLETINLFGKIPEISSLFKNRLLDWITIKKSGVHTAPIIKIEEHKETFDQLKSLGYIQ